MSHSMNWLRSIGMCCNPLKTEVVIFGYGRPRCSMTLSESELIVKDTTKILVVTLQKDLKWGNAGLAIKKANSTSNSIQQVNGTLPRKLH